MVKGKDDRNTITSRSPTLAKLVLVIRKDRRVHFSFLSLILFIVFIFASFTILPVGTNPSGTSLDYGFGLSPGYSTSTSYTTIIPHGSYVNLSYDIPSGSSGSFTITEKPYNFPISGNPSVVESESLTGSGIYVYHNLNSSESITLTLNAGRGMNSSNPSFILSINPYYEATFNPYIFMLSMLALLVFCVSLASAAMRISKNTTRYYEKLGWTQATRKDNPKKMNSLLFVIPGLLFYIFAVMVGQGSNGGLLLLSIISYAIASGFVLGALIAFFLGRMQ